LLTERRSTRPFLSLIEKRWIAFQLLTGLRDIHERNVAHGDIKSENILCTTANWVYIADFACFKPTFLPLNDPADFAYFFDASGRRTCNLAPERFYAPDEEKPDLAAHVTEAMDVFALGCVLAEICSDGVSPFTLSQLFKYRSGEFSPNLSRIEDSALKVRLPAIMPMSYV
jgi:phosphoinositide-3-kinase regulatory subunit 4